MLLQDLFRNLYRPALELFLGSLDLLADQVIIGGGVPVALHCNLTVVPSVASTSTDDSSKTIRGGTVNKGDKQISHEYKTTSMTTSTLKNSLIEMCQIVIVR